jgi:hypothetical protein
MLRVKAAPSSSKHIRTTEKGHWSDPTFGESSGLSKGIVRNRQTSESDTEAYPRAADEGVNPVHRPYPSLQKVASSLLSVPLLVSLCSQSSPDQEAMAYDDNEEDEEGY